VPFDAIVLNAEGWKSNLHVLDVLGQAFWLYWSNMKRALVRSVTWVQSGRWHSHCKQEQKCSIAAVRTVFQALAKSVHGAREGLAEGLASRVRSRNKARLPERIALKKMARLTGSILLVTPTVQMKKYQIQLPESRGRCAVC